MNLNGSEFGMKFWFENPFQSSCSSSLSSLLFTHYVMYFIPLILWIIHHRSTASLQYVCNSLFQVLWTGVRILSGRINNNEHNRLTMTYSRHDQTDRQTGSVTRPEQRSCREATSHVKGICNWKVELFTSCRQSQTKAQEGGFQDKSQSSPGEIRIKLSNYYYLHLISVSPGMGSPILICYSVCKVALVRSS